MDGVLVVDKPSGMTSHDVVARVRQALNVRRVGHMGTLDPMATGVLPLMVGRATRLASLLSVGRKTYEGTILLGVTTDTYDATGSITTDIRNKPAAIKPLDRAEIERAAEPFIGTFMQRPPPFSAKKIAGVRAYRLARRHQAVDPAPVQVTVHALELLSVDSSYIRCRVICEPGFYMRALAHDLGAVLGCGACLETLRRKQNGIFGVEEAVTINEIRTAESTLSSRIIPIAELLPDIPRIVLSHHGVERASHGNNLSQAHVITSNHEWRKTPATTEGNLKNDLRDLVKLYDEEGTLVAIAKVDAARVLRPAIVLV